MKKKIFNQIFLKVLLRYSTIRHNYLALDKLTPPKCRVNKSEHKTSGSLRVCSVITEQQVLNHKKFQYNIDITTFRYFWLISKFLKKECF